MWWLINTSIVSLCLIALIHHLWHFLRDHFTTPKLKDLVDEMPVYTAASPPSDDNELIEFMKQSMNDGTFPA